MSIGMEQIIPIVLTVPVILLPVILVIIAKVRGY